MTSVVVSPDADDDIKDILTWLGTHAQLGVMERYSQRFIETLRGLGDRPGTGAPRPKLGRSIRIKIVSPYLVIYRYRRKADAVEVLRVMHGRRRISKRSIAQR